MLKLFVYILAIVLINTSAYAEEHVVDPSLTTFGSNQAGDAEIYRLDGSFSRLANVSQTISSKGATFYFSGQFPLLSSLNIRGTSGTLSLILNGDMPSLSYLDLDQTSGDITIDLQSQLLASANLVIKTTSGNIHLKLAPQINAKVDVKTSSGTVKAYGLKKPFWKLFKDSYESDKNVEGSPINIAIETTSGNVFLNQ